MKLKNIIIYLSLIAFIVGISFLFPKATKKTYAAGTTLVEVVKLQNKGDSWSSGASGVYYTNGHEYRYIGSEVNNYVKFNNDMYRIIGVFDDYTHGVTDDNGNSVELVKLIRNRMFGSYSWGVYNTSNQSETFGGYLNDWVGDRGTLDTSDDTSPSNLNILLNQFFYNKSKTITGYSDCSFWTYFSGAARYKFNDCSSIVGYGIKDNVRDYIENVTWHLKGLNERALGRNEFYTCERSRDTEINNCSSGGGGTYSKSVAGKIGLMYMSDYLYANGYYKSNQNVTGGSANPTRLNWLYKGYEWLITPDGDSTTGVFSIQSTGQVESINSYYSRGVRPTFYLKSSVYITGGNGSFDNPYTLACDDCSS